MANKGVAHRQDAKDVRTSHVLGRFHCRSIVFFRGGRQAWHCLVILLNADYSSKVLGVSHTTPRNHPPLYTLPAWPEFCREIECP